MCNHKQKTMQTRSKKVVNVISSNELDETEYYQLQNTERIKKKPKKSRLLEKIVFTMTTVTMVFLSHALFWAQWTLPIFYVIATPILVGIKTAYYWKRKYQYFMIDFCYVANLLLFTFLLIPSNDNMFLVTFALSNGPLFMAMTVWKNSLVYHHHDKITSIYIHLLPALVTFSIRWFPSEASWLWYQPLVTEMPTFDPVWLYVIPLGCFLLHSLLYCLIVNVIVRPTDSYLTSYSYMTVKYDKLQCIKGPIGQGICFYGFSWLYCLLALLVQLISYQYFVAHCAILAAIFLVIVWNGAGYYMHVFSERGFSDSDEQ